MIPQGPPEFRRLLDEQSRWGEKAGAGNGQGAGPRGGVAGGGGEFRKARDRSEFQRLLPQAPDAERGVLSSFLLASVEIGNLCRERAVTRAHFHHPAHQLMYDQLAWLHGEGMPVDLVGFTQMLRDQQLLEACGGPAYVAEVYSFLPTACNVTYYLDIVREKYELRQAIQACQEYTALCYDAPDQAPARLSDLAARISQITEERAQGGIRQMLAERAFDALHPPAEPEVILKLGEWSIATPENIVALQAKVKAGKTAALGAIIASTMEPEGDCLGFSSSNPHGKAVIHFDTEQSRYHHHLVLARALGRAGREEAPAWLRSYYLKGLSIAQLQAALWAELERGQRECGGVHMAILDGIGDFCADVNDPEMAFALIAELEMLAVKYQTTFVVVLHENPGSETGKTRGHLGSHLERKAETNLRLEKDAEGVTVMYSERSRTAHIPRDLGPRFAWNEEARMHTSTTADFTPAGKKKKDPAARRGNSRQVAAMAALGEYFADGQVQRFTKLEACVTVGEKKIKERTFSNYWLVLKHAGLIVESPNTKGAMEASTTWAKELEKQFSEDEE